MNWSEIKNIHVCYSVFAIYSALPQKVHHMFFYVFFMFLTVSYIIVNKIV